MKKVNFVLEVLFMSVITLISIVLVLGAFTKELKAATISDNIATSTEVLIKNKIKVYSYNQNILEKSNVIYPCIRIENLADAELDLENVKLEYIFSADKKDEINCQLDYTSKKAENIKLNIEDHKNENKKISINFKNNPGILKKNEKVDIEFRIWNNDLTYFDQFNDFSFSKDSHEYTQNDKVLGYINNIIFWGSDKEKIDKVETEFTFLGIEKSSIVNTLERCYKRWESGYYIADNNGVKWENALYNKGKLSLYNVNADESLLESVSSWALKNEYRIDINSMNIKTGSIYFDLFKLTKDESILSNTIEVSIDLLNSDNSLNTTDKTFSMLHLFALTGNNTNKKYNDYFSKLDRVYREAKTNFYNNETKLWYYNQDDKRNKIYWSRSNAFIFADIVDIIELLPKESPLRKEYIEIYTQMLHRIKESQKFNGTWSVNMLTEDRISDTVSTELFLYGICKGMRLNLIDISDYGEVVNKAWYAIFNKITDNGDIIGCQPISASSADKFNEYNSNVLGVSGLLISGNELYKLFR